jgi:hypothetical protein
MTKRIFKLTFFMILLEIIIAFNITCKKEAKEQTQSHDCPQGQHWDDALQKCVDDSILPVDTTSNLLSDTTILVDSLNVVSSTETSVTINATNFTKQPTVGCILLAPPCTNAEYGFIRKVTSITGDKSKLVCQTVFCGLNEAFKQLNFNYIYTDTFSSSITGKGASLSYKFSNKVLAPGLAFSGIIKLNIPSIEWDYKMKKGSVLPEHALIKAFFNTEGSSLEITNSTENNIQLLKPDTLGTFYLPTIEIPITIPTPLGIIVIPLPFQQQINFTTYPFTVKGKATFNIAPVINCVLGSECVNGKWQNLSSMSIQSASTSEFCKNNFSANISATSEYTIFNPIYSIAPYNSDFLKFHFEIPNKLSFTVQSNSPNYSLDYSLDITGGIKTKIWDGLENDFDVTLNLIKENLAKGDWISCNSTPTLTTSQVTSITQTSAISGGNIIDSGGSPIIAKGVCWSTSQNPTISDNKTSDGTGTGSFTSSLSGLDSNTTYYVRAYATNSAGTVYGNEVNFTTLQDITVWDGVAIRDSCSCNLVPEFQFQMYIGPNTDTIYGPVNDSTYLVTLITGSYFSIYIAYISPNSSSFLINWDYNYISGDFFVAPSEPWVVSGNTCTGRASTGNPRVYFTIKLTKR